MIKELTLDETREIYKKYMMKDFPPGERRPLISIEKMWEDGCYFGYGYYDEGEFYGYALFCAAPGAKDGLLEYLAMTESSRGKGKGSAFLKELATIEREWNAIILETEDADFAETEAELAERTRRDRFYEKAGVKLSSFRSEVFGVKYRLWYLQLCNIASEQEYGEEYVKTYRYIFERMNQKDKFLMYDKGNENFETIRM
ncbi:MAG: GNAT family N-acetyltransferase [Lachnospiraceae bacterium]|nr:GNAT family N-acetyltransferase [Lachnospiraceae bacterium]